MTTYLLDVNVLIALAWPNHIHHEPAHEWLSRHTTDRWATCPVTQSGFVRVSTNPKIIPEARSLRAVIGLLERIVSLPNHIFWSDEVSIVTSPHIARERLTGHGQVTDAHLLAVALAHGGKLASFDRGLKSLVPSSIEPESALDILPAGPMPPS